MEIQKNSRQIPSDKIYTADKKYNDLLYGYLQHISHYDEKTNMRFVFKKDIVYTRIGEVLNMTRQTVSTKLNNLIKKGLLIYDEDNKLYELVSIDKDLAALLPDDTIRILCNTLKERCLSIFAYLLKTYIQHEEKPCQITLDVIKEHVGLCSKNRCFNNEIIKDCLAVLRQLGLIEYHEEKVADITTGSVKRVYILDKVNNKTAIQ